MHCSTTSPEDCLTFHVEVLDETSRDFTSSVLINDYIMTEKKILDVHRLSFIYEYIFCRCFPHKTLDVDSFFLCVCLFVSALVIG